jgi:hypothetical protein
MGYEIKRRRMPQDARRLAKLRRMPRRADGSVGVRHTARTLGIGKDAARRLLQMADLYRPIARTGA